MNPFEEDDSHDLMRPPAATLPPEAERAADAEKVGLIVDLAHALHAAGAPAHRLEATVDAVGRALGLQAAVFAQPTSVYLQVGEAARLLRVEPREVALDDLIAIDRLARAVEHGRLSPARARAALQALPHRPPRWTRPTRLAAAAGTAGAAVVFFGGGLPELLLAALLSAATALFPARHANLHPLLAAVGVGLAARAAASLGPVQVDVVLLAGLICLLPGFTLTTGLTELATRHLASGSARLSAAGVTLLQLGVGVGIATALADRLGWTSLPAPPRAVPGMLSMALALALASLSFLVAFRARARDLPAILGVAILAVASTRLGAQALGPQVAPFLGALAVGLAANAYARLVGVPALLLLVPGLILLVPGSLGLSSVRALVSQGGELLDGARMLMVGASLASGMLAANALLPPRRPL